MTCKLQAPPGQCVVMQVAATAQHSCDVRWWIAAGCLPLTSVDDGHANVTQHIISDTRAQDVLGHEAQGIHCRPW